jgi:type IV pilus assembly protein PilW
MNSQHSTPALRRLDRARRVAQRGFSLIELMVAIGMALFLAAGLITTVVTLKGTFNSQDQMGQLQENQRFTLTVLSNTLHNAGYFATYQSKSRSDAFPAVSGVNLDGSSFDSTQFLTGTEGAASDTIDLRFQTADGDTLTNCLGGTNTTGAPVTWTNSFAVIGNQLVCSVGINGVGPTGDNKNVVVADQVASMQILYGTDTTNRGSVDQYLRATDMTAVLWGRVRSVQISITFLDPLKSTPTNPVPLPTALVQTISVMNLQ